MSQEDFTIATGDANTGVTFRAAINAALQALATVSSGATAPATPFLCQLWADTANNKLKQRNKANTAWVIIGDLDTVNLGLMPLTGGTFTGSITLEGPLTFPESGDEYIRVPRLTTTQRDALSPTAGMLIYNTTTGFFQAYYGAAWKDITNVTSAQIQSGSLVYAPDTGAADVYVAAFTPTLTVLTTGMVLRVKIANANATTTPTLKPDSLGAKTIVRDGGQALKVGDLPANYYAVFQYNGTQLELLNPAMPKSHDHTGTAQGGSLGANSVVAANIMDGAVTQTKLFNYTAGDVSFHGNPAEKSTISDTYVKLKETVLSRGGTFRIKFDLRGTGGDTAVGKIYRNGSPVGTERATTSTSDVTFSQDIAGWSVGDSIQVWCRRDLTATAYVNDFNIFVAEYDNAYSNDP